MTDIEPIAATNPDPGLAKAVQERLDTAEAKVASKRAAKKPASARVPKPFVGYLVENADFAPPPRTKQSWLFHLSPLFYGIADAESERVGFQAMAPKCPPKTIFKVTITFEVVEGSDSA